MDWELIFWVVAPIVAWIGFGIWCAVQPEKMSDEWLNKHKEEWE